MRLRNRTAGVLVAFLVGGAGAVAVAEPSRAAASSVAARGHTASSVSKFFWSSVLRLFITISTHASRQMSARNVSHTLLRTILNDDKRTTRNGVAYVRHGNYEARVNATSGKVITVVKLSGGGGGGGGV